MKIKSWGVPLMHSAPFWIFRAHIVQNQTACSCLILYNVQSLRVPTHWNPKESILFTAVLLTTKNSKLIPALYNTASKKINSCEPKTTEQVKRKYTKYTSCMQ